jgi:hypothetical protein
LETKNAGIARGEGAYMGGWHQLKNGLLFAVSLAIRSFSNVLKESQN